MFADITEDKLAKALEKTLSDAAFLFVEEKLTDSSWKDTNLVMSQISLKANDRTKLVIVTEDDFCSYLTVNLLGGELDAEYNKENEFDALGEVANIIGGILMEGLEIPADKSGLHVPKVQEISVATFEKLIKQAPFVVSKSVDDQFQVVVFMIEDVS